MNSILSNPHLPAKDFSEPPDSARVPEPNGVPQNVTEEKAESRDSFRLTDLGNARRLVQRHGRNLRFCYPWRKWLTWDGRRWCVDDTGEVERDAKDTVLAIYREAAELPEERRRTLINHALETERRTARLSAMVDLARSEPGIPVLPAELDQDPWVLNCANGVLDLRTGSLRPHDRRDLITKLAPVAYCQDAPAPVWESFLGVIFAENPRLINYVQRLAGLWLTGDVREQILPIFHGVGANGKSTLLTALLEMLGKDYALKAPPDLLMVKGGDTHPTERADLFGRRLVVANETEDGKRLAESLVKDLTGGDRIRARRMREDFWEFAPTHKIVLCTNHRPIIKGTDHAMWRRMRLFPFDVVIPDEKQDKDLPTKLRAERPGILAWAVRGCLGWQRGGLGLPEEVQAATQAYRDEQDTLGAFITELCLVGNDYRCKFSGLFDAYQGYCKRGGENAVNQRAFGAALKGRGFASYTNNGTWYRGLAVRPQTEATEGTEPCYPLNY